MDRYAVRNHALRGLMDSDHYSSYASNLSGSALTEVRINYRLVPV